MSTSNYNIIKPFQELKEYMTVDSNIFQELIQLGQPAILRGIIKDQPTNTWTLDYLTDKLGDELVTIHESDDPNLDFLQKSFVYKKYPFREFKDKLKDPGFNRSYYYRSINKNPRVKRPARIEEDLPELRESFKLPEFIPHGSNNSLYYSSVLRIASKQVQIWTHFDLYDNILFQIVGKKRIILFPPSETEYLYVQGDKSTINNFDDWNECLVKHPDLCNSRPYEGFLYPTDGIFIPALWWHNVKTVDLYESNQDYSIGFNVFWKDSSLVSSDVYATSDVYGNKNPQAYESALSNLDKAISHLDKLPGKYSDFYKTMLMITLKNKLSQVKS